MLVVHMFIGCLALATPSLGRLFEGSLDEASDKGLDFITSHIADDGQFIAPYAEEDIWHYFKLPMVLSTGGRIREANLVLDHIKTNFMQDDGDFKTSFDVKSNIPGAAEYYAYTNAWIVMAAQRMERYDVLVPGLAYLRQYLRCFPTNGPPSEGHTSTSIMTASYLGTLALATGDRNTARRAVRQIEKFIKLQPDLDSGFYYSMDKGSLTTEFDPSLSMRYFLNRTAPYQHFLEVSYPAAFLATYYRYTDKQKYLDMAKDLLIWLRTCHESMYALTSSTQKIAVASSLVAALTNDKDILDMAERSSQFLLSMQNEDGSFFNPATRRAATSDEVPLTLRLVDATL